MATVTIKGGAKLKAALKEIEKKASKGGTLRVGFLEGATYPNGQPVAMVAAIQNFGAPGASIPPRPFFSNMVKEKSPGWGGSLERILPSVGYDGARALALMGEGISAQLRESIIATNEPALSPITLMLRKMYGNNPQDITGRSVGEAARRVADGEQGATGTQAKPLVWTGHLLNSVGYEVAE